MTGENSHRSLHWEASYEIVLCLKQEYPAIDLESLGTRQLLDMILNLPGFVDEPELANETLLNDILREWYEEIM